MISILRNFFLNFFMALAVEGLIRRMRSRLAIRNGGRSINYLLSIAAVFKLSFTASVVGGLIRRTRSRLAVRNGGRSNNYFLPMDVQH